MQKKYKNIAMWIVQRRITGNFKRLRASRNRPERMGKMKKIDIRNSGILFCSIVKEKIRQTVNSNRCIFIKTAYKLKNGKVKVKGWDGYKTDEFAFDLTIDY